LNLSPTIDTTELLVVIIGIIGLTISLIMVAVIQASRRGVRRRGVNGINKRMTNSDLRNELSRTYKLACFVVIGLIQMTVPPPIRYDNRMAGEVFKWMLISWEMVATVNSLWGYVDHRRNMDDLLEMEHAQTQGQNGHHEAPH
jgi:hypothetical protein